MDDSAHTPKNSDILKTRESTLEKILFHLTPAFVKRFVLRNLLSDGLYLSNTTKATVAGCVVMWYQEEEVRQFIMVRANEGVEKSRFVSFIDLESPHTANQMMQKAVSTQLGDIFYKAFDEKLLSSDCVIAAPTFYGKDSITDANVPLQTLVWAVQITPEQAQLIETEQANQELTLISEYGVLGPDVEPTHKVIYQTVLRSIHNRSRQQNNLSNDRLQQLLDAVDTRSRILH